MSPVSPLNESMVEDAALEWFGELGYGSKRPRTLVMLRDPLLPKLLSRGLSVAESGSIV